MTVIAKDIFTIAMTLMDEESQDGTFEGYPSEYKRKAWPILTMLQTELLPPNVEPMAVTSENNPMLIDDRLSITALSYGLAAHLIMTEDQGQAAFFNSRYDELKVKKPAVATEIEDVFGIFSVSETKEDTDETTIELDGGSFLDPNNVIYDRGEF